ncbi:HNH endonuclease [Streptomyces scabiei]|uniref:HNH endonuclease n=1 Tax=Streptomyces scabiei TaxID=1930 RepID=UPI0029A90A42|nr:HNH endonuclease signature motif containing protein [Streptomyces scabiei]MDX3029669.1 HNH endonuclease signature motif containing protein [Streptomyces scabiei]
MPAWLQGAQARRAISREPALPDGLGRFGMGYKIALHSGIGAGKTIEAGRLVEDMIRGAASPPVLWLVNGQTRARDLLGINPVPDAAEHPTTPGELLLREEPFARRKARARSVPWRARYRELRRRADTWEAAGRDQDRVFTSAERRVRSGAAREAVLLRSQGRCENPDCLLAVLPYRTAAGQPLLEIDHIDDHAQGGRDHPGAMIALCPNCHANKTRGADRIALRERLRGVAQALDAAVMQQEQDGPRT